MPIKEDDDDAAVSPSRTRKVQLMDFAAALKEVVSGKKISKKEWEQKCEKESYGYMHDMKLCLYRPSDTAPHRAWQLNDGDILGEDWYVMQD